MKERGESSFENLPDHLLIEIFVRVPVRDWTQLSSVKKRWGAIFRRDCLWQTALTRTWPLAAMNKRWPGPIPQGSAKRRYLALYASEHIISYDGDLDELMGHAYLFLKEQLEQSTFLPSPSLLHGTLIDQFIACGKSRDRADQLASTVWISVIAQLDDNESTFNLLKLLAREKEVFLPYPYTRSTIVQWKVFEKLLTDFRDCFNRVDYFDFLARAQCKFQIIPSAWLGY